jgi:hypothetical protein
MILYVVLMTDSERQTWDFFEKLQFYTLYMWVALLAMCFLVADNSDIVFQYIGGFVVTGKS